MDPLNPRRSVPASSFRSSAPPGFQINPREAPAASAEESASQAALYPPNPVCTFVCNPAFLTFLFLFGVYLLSLGRQIGYTADAHPVMEVTEQIIWEGSFTRPLYGEEPYSMYGLGMSLWYLPIRWALEVLQPAGRVEAITPSQAYWLRQGFILLNALASAGIGAILVTWSARTGVALKYAIAGALCHGLATLQFPYARYDFSEPVAGFFLLVGMMEVWRGRRSPSWRPFLIAGTALGCGALTRIAIGLAAVGISAFVFCVALKNRRPLHLAAFLAPLIGALALVFYYNHARFGSVIETGYPIRFDTPLFEGAAGLLFSFGRGVLLYSPVSVVGIVFLFTCRRFDRFGKGMIAFVCLFFLLLHAKWRFWYGGWCWGPRLLLPALPLAGLGLAELFERSTHRRVWGIALFGVGGLINLLGTYVPYTNYLHSAMQKYHEDKILWEPNFSALKIHHEMLTEFKWYEYDFIWLAGNDYGGGVYAVAGGGLILTLGSGVLLLRKLRESEAIKERAG